jgi:hypothetical protein
MTNESQVDHPVVWAVDYGKSDITHLMRNAISAKVYYDLVHDSDIGS